MSKQTSEFQEKTMSLIYRGKEIFKPLYGIKGTVDKKLSANLERLKEQGYPFQYKIFTELGHGGLAGEQPERFLKEMTNAHKAQGECRK